MIVMRRFLVIPALAFGLLLIVESCKDMGNEVPPPPPPPPQSLTAGQTSFTILPGGTAATKLSGGTAPYLFISQGSTSVVVPTIVGDSLKLRAVALGSSIIIVGDSGPQGFADTVNVSVTLLAVGQNLFNLLVGDSSSTTISGGTAPYSFVSTGDTAKVVTSISGNSLKVRALAVGSSSIVLQDNSSPRLSATISVNVTTPVSFAAQVQPIFTTNCVNAGCHPGGGAPFPLQAGVSYGRLVGVTATNGIGSCPGDKRVLPLNADASVLIKRITGTCGLAQMPLGGTPLPADQIQLIRDWINQGARNN